MPRPINTPTTASKNSTMESSSKESQNLFKRLITYHCFRENKYAKGTASYLNKIYGKSFISEGAVQKWFKLFKDKEEFSFDDICSLGYVARKRRSEKPIPEDPPELDAETEQELANGEAKQMEEKGAVKVKRTATGKVVAKKAASSSTGDTGGPDGGAETAGDGSGSENNTTNLDRCEKRKLILRCYKAKYSVGEANRYLNSIHGQGFINKTSVYTWYRRFEQKDFKLGDKNRSGRPQKVDDAKGKEIIAYVEGNPSVNLRQIASAFKLSTGTLSRLLPKLGFQYVVDKWVKTQERPEVTDDQLRAFKEANPTAKVKEVAEHFMISRIVIAQRLRKLGFDIPKWPKKKKNAAGAAASGDANPSAGSSGGQVDASAKSRGRSTKGRQTTSQPQPQLGPGQQPGPESIHPQSTPGAQLVNVKLDFGPANLAAEAQMRAMQMVAEQQHNQNHHDPGTQQSQTSVPPQTDHSQQGGQHPLSRINMEQLLSLQQHSPHNGPPPTGSQGPSPGPSGPPQPPPPQHIEQSQSQQQQPQQYVMNLAQVSVNSLLPAVLRRKPNAILPGSLVKGPGGPPPPPPQQQQQVPVSLGGNPMGGGGLGGGQGPNEVRDLRIGISQMAENLSTNGSQQQQQGPRPIVTSNGYHMPPTSSLMTSHVTHSGPYSSHGASLQNLVQATASGGSQQQPGQQQGQQQGPGGQHDPMNGFDPYNAPPLDSIQVQNILHPYYQ